MAWANGPLTVYHGTDSVSAVSIRAGINAAFFRPRTDFGAGFYVTTVPHQARQWANQRSRRTAAATAEVLEYQLSRDAVEARRHLAFTADDADYYEFVAYCRAGLPNHGPAPRMTAYDIVYGPVSYWPQRLVLANCDQILLSDPNGLGTDFRYVRSIAPPPPGRFF